MKTQIVAACIAVVLVAACITAGIVYSVQQGTERRHDCIENGGSWTSNNQCLRFVQVVD